MSANLQSKINKLRADYSQVKGRAFVHFYCPILFKDEAVPVCKAHIINRSFRDSSRHWTVLRKDVDNFYGSNFEAEFVAMQHNDDRPLDKIVSEQALWKRFKPNILVDGEAVELFVTHGHVPEHFTVVEFVNDGQVVPLGLKMSPRVVLAAMGQKWEIAVFKDVRIPALVSLLKAAHLTLFDMLGYRYALSCGGQFVGRQILGEFFLRNHHKPKPHVLRSAHSFFRDFAHMARPVQTSGLDLQGTVRDGLLLICKGNSSPPWAFVVFIKTSWSLHAVMIPIFDQADTGAKFMRFLQDESDSIEATLARFEHDHWQINKESTKLHWPKSGILYP